MDSQENLQPLIESEPPEQQGRLDAAYFQIYTLFSVLAAAKDDDYRVKLYEFHTQDENFGLCVLPPGQPSPPEDLVVDTNPAYTLKMALLWLMPVGQDWRAAEASDDIQREIVTNFDRIYMQAWQDTKDEIYQPNPDEEKFDDIPEKVLDEYRDWRMADHPVLLKALIRYSKTGRNNIPAYLQSAMSQAFGLEISRE